MATYIVEYSETCFFEARIEADDKQQAKKILKDGNHDCESDRLINSYDFEIGDVRKEGEE